MLERMSKICYANDGLCNFLSEGIRGIEYMSASPRRLGKYELNAQLGRGNTGEVWQGSDTQARQNVAIKMLHPDLLQADPHFMSLFVQDWQPVIALQHPNIVRVREVNISRPPAFDVTAPYIVMDFVEGRITLSEGIRRTSRAGKFPDVSDIVHIFKDLGDALDYAHAQGVVHGDIKPANILLDMQDVMHGASTEALLTDFGIALLPGNQQRTSPAYLSPEQVKGESPGVRSDIYALGVILFELCTGVLPFHAESRPAVMMQHVNSLPTPPILINPYIPPALSEVILRAMSKEAHTRFASASQLAAAVAEACEVKAVSGGARVRKRSSFADVPHTQNGSGPLGSPYPGSLLAGEQRATMSGVSRPLPSLSAKRSDVNTDSAGAATGPHLLQPPIISGRLTAPVSQPIGPLSQQMVPVHTSQALVEDRMRYRPASNLSPLVVMIALLFLLLVVVGSLGLTALRFSAGRQTGAPAANASSGHVFFQDDALGHDDTLHMQLQNVPAPTQGKRYFAWLQNTGGTIAPLGPLSVQNGTTQLAYLGDGKHTNLLASVQGVFVTLENAGQTTPQAPSLDAKVYQSSFSGASFQYVQHILYLLPGFPGHTSLIAGLFDTIGSMNDQAGSIVDSLGGRDYGLVARQANRVLVQIDGSQYARASGDLPASQPMLQNVQVGLLSSPGRTGYVDTLSAQVQKVLQTAGTDAGLRQHAQNVTYALRDLDTWIGRMRGYAEQILRARTPSAPAVSAAALQLRQLAQESYTGLTIPPNAGPLPILGSAGVYQASVECQYLATLNIKKVA
jgi:eukaryotic-like serine/threonine-protein kinase